VKHFPWPEFIWLLLTAIALYYLKWPILVIAALVGLVNAWLWFCHRYPRTMFILTAFLRGLLRRR
jgi:hypothetical protein